MGFRGAGKTGALLLLLGTCAGAQQPGAWQLSLRLRETYDTNVRLRSDPNPEDFLTSATAVLARRFRGQRTTATLSATGGRLWYLERPDRDRWHYAGSLELASRLSPRAQLIFSDAFISTYTNEVVDLAEDGTLLQLSALRRNRARLGLALGLSATTSLDLITLHDVNDYADPTLVDGRRLGAGATLARRLSARTGATLAYDFQKNDRTREVSQVHSASLGLSQAAGARTQLSVSGGIGHVRSAGRTATRLVGSAGLVYRLQRGSISLQYQRRIRQTFGLGRETTNDSLDWNLQHRLGRRLGVNAGLTYVHAVGAFVRTDELEAQKGQAGLSFQATRDLSLFAGYVYQRRTRAFDTSRDRASAHRPNIQVSYNLGW